MKIYEVKGNGIDGLTLAERPEPKPGYGQSFAGTAHKRQRPRRGLCP